MHAALPTVEADTGIPTPPPADDTVSTIRGGPCSRQSHRTEHDNAWRNITPGMDTDDNIESCTHLKLKRDSQARPAAAARTSRVPLQKTQHSRAWRTCSGVGNPSHSAITSVPTRADTSARNSSASVRVHNGAGEPP